MPRFSIILPVHVWNDYRQMSLARAIKSIENQTFKDFELIVVNDGSTREFTVPKWVRLINKNNEERIIAYNAGFKKAKGEIYCTLDSDDEYEPNYLERVDSFFRQYPTYKLFNFGATFIHADGNVTKREVFQPAELEIGHEVFGGGNVVSGTFVWHRDVYKDLGAFPKKLIKNIDCSEINYSKGKRDLSMMTPYDFSAAAQMEFPEIRKYFMVDFEGEPEKIIKELGNPWGQDYFLFYKYTRKYHSKPIDDAYLYIVHLKAGVE